MPTKTKSMKRCETCAFWNGPMRGDDLGYCHRMCVDRPARRPYDFCGEWQPQSWHEEVPDAD